MQIVKTEGFILSDTSYGETSKILNVLTKDYGIIGIMSKGCKSLKSKLRGVSNKMTYGYFHIYYKESGLSTLITVDLIDPFLNITKDLERVSYVTYLMELVNQVVKQTDDNIFPVFIETIKKINEGYDSLVLTNILELKMLDALGVKPNLDECAVCGNVTNILTISGSMSGFICENCHTNEKIVSSKTIQLMRMFYYVDISKISKLEINENAKKEINEFIDEYYDKYTGLYLKSKKFLKTILKIK